jgi:uncharacterized protein (DUF2342 family)
MLDKAIAYYLKMPVDEKIIKERLAKLVNSKSQDDKKIIELVDKAEALKRRLDIQTE